MLKTEKYIVYYGTSYRKLCTGFTFSALEYSLVHESDIRNP